MPIIFKFSSTDTSFESSVWKELINVSKLSLISFDYIVLSPGIDIKKCKISNYLKKNRSKIITELDIFAISYPNINKITITGTNGKSTTAKLLFEILKDQKKDVILAGNIGIPILSKRKIKPSTVFVIEASSYQLEYSKYWRFFIVNYYKLLYFFWN